MQKMGQEEKRKEKSARIQLSKKTMRQEGKKRLEPGGV